MPLRWKSVNKMIKTNALISVPTALLRDRFLFGSGYPYIPLKQAVDLFVAMPFDRSILPNLLYKNMARVLKLDVD